MTDSIRYQRANMFPPSCFNEATKADFEDWPTFGDFLLVVGPNGTGKSHFAAAASHELGGWPKVKWVGVPDLSLWLRRAMDRGNDDSEAYIRSDLLEARVLVLDDLLAGRNTDYVLSTLLGVVNGRLERRSPTIATCDRGLKEIEAWDSSLASRLGGFDLVKLVGEDRRLKNRRVFDVRSRVRRDTEAME